jgi:hypothetical protein
MTIAVTEIVDAAHLPRLKTHNVSEIRSASVFMCNWERGETTHLWPLESGPLFS